MSILAHCLVVKNNYIVCIDIYIFLGDVQRSVFRLSFSFGSCNYNSVISLLLFNTALVNFSSKAGPINFFIGLFFAYHLFLLNKNI